jgi:hypothetical protein
VSTLTLADVFAADAALVHRSAAAWAALAEDLDNAYELFVQGLRQVDRGVSGQAALAAVRRLTEQGHRLSSACNPARRIADALDRHAYGVADLRRMIVAVGNEARANSLYLNWTTGQLSAPPTVMKVDEPAVWLPVINRLRTDLREILDRARVLDDATTAAIRSSLPSPVGDGFGASMAWYVDRDMVAMQRGRSPQEVHYWWLSLSPEQQEQVLRDYPDLVGWLDGVPATDRDRANRVNLEAQLTELQYQEADLRRRIEEAKQAYADAHTAGARYPVVDARLNVLMAELNRNQSEQAGLRAVRDELGQLGSPALLMGIDGHGDGRAVIAMGDPDKASHAAIFVPGINTDLQDIGGDMDRVRNLRDASDRLTPAASDVSVIYWLGYDPPGTLGALGHGPSHDGGKAFTPFVDGLRITHQLDTAAYHVTAVGHSYGSTVVAEAALGGGLKVDDIVTAGSPGMHTDRAFNLNLDPRHVWGGLAAGDPVAGWAGSIWGVHDNEPTDEDFGANRYVVDTEGHSGYWTPNSTSLTNQAYIIVGQYNLVSLEHGSPPRP